MELASIRIVEDGTKQSTRLKCVAMKRIPLGPKLKALPGTMPAAVLREIAVAASTAGGAEAVDDVTAELAVLPLEATEPAVAADEFEVERGELTPLDKLNVVADDVHYAAVVVVAAAAAVAVAVADVVVVADGPYISPLPSSGADVEAVSTAASPISLVAPPGTETTALLTPGTDCVTALEEDKEIVVFVDMVNLADDTVIDEVVASCRENFVAVGKASGEVGLVFSSGLGDTIMGEAPIGEAPIGELDRSEIVLPVLALRWRGAEGREKPSPIKEADGGLLPATAPVVVPDPWEVPSFDLFEEFSFASCCFASSSSDFFVFLGAPNALSHTLKFGFSLEPEELELEPATIFSAAVDLPPTSKVLAVSKASKGLCLSLASVVSSVCVSIQSSLGSKDVVAANIVTLGKGSKPSRTISLLFLSFSSTSLSAQVDKTGLTAALFTVLLANSSIKDDCPKPKLSVFITVPRLSLGTLSAVSTINEFLTSLALAATALPGCKRSIVRKRSLRRGFVAACNFSLRDLRLASLAICCGGGGCKSNCVSFGLGAVIVVNVGGTVVGGGISKGVFAAAAADDKEAIEGAFTEELFEEAFTVVLPTELPEVTE
uniref:Uncharacterized protein n=1 Tax=Glossina palpalis gambiensis TaxID=67801 RepID=A0A1B0B585_9MUSC